MVPTSPGPSSVESLEGSGILNNRRFSDLRGIRWRLDLGILPSSLSSIDDLRRVTADSRRRYAALRRQLLVDPHVLKDGSISPEPVIDNPLSQNPDSMWGRFFRNAELERMVDQDLSRLYPEHGSYFQTHGCQGILRRILLLWCLRHPKYGYQQGMHELLAPLLYVLHADVEHLSEVRELYEEHFNDKFDGFSFHESNLTYKFDFKKFSGFAEDGIGPHKRMMKGTSLDELDPKIQDIILLSDAYGAEGELGIIVSEKFMEHDAYCMFEVLMNGAGGAVALADFFNSFALNTLHTGVPPVIEASSALYHLLSIVDSSLHSHLVELGVEPQYFALRWLRVLFGREFALQDLLVIWDEIFASDNTKSGKYADDEVESGHGVLSSLRGAFVSAFSVSMILHLRSSLLATENATSCLKRLLNFPEGSNLRKLITKAKSLQTLAVETNNSMRLPLYDGKYDQCKSTGSRRYSLSFDSVSPTSPLNLVPESYWEDKWRVLHKDQENETGAKKQIENRIKGWSQKVKLRLSRTESDPTPPKDRRKVQVKTSVRRNLLVDLARQLGSDEDIDKLVRNEDAVQQDLLEDVQDDFQNSCTIEERCLSGNVSNEDNSSVFSDGPSPKGEASDHGNQSESSIASNISAEDNLEANNFESCRTDSEGSSIPVLYSVEDASFNSGHDGKDVEKEETNVKDPKIKSGRFQWFWKFGRHAGEETPEKGGCSGVTKACSDVCSRNEVGNTSNGDALGNSTTSRGDAYDPNVLATMRNLGQSMRENIQVIESVFQQDRGQVKQLESFSKNVLVGKGQVTAMAALKELRKISNLLSEM